MLVQAKTWAGRARETIVNMESDSHVLETSLHGNLEDYLYPQMRLQLFQ